MCLAFQGVHPGERVPEKVITLQRSPGLRDRYDDAFLVHYRNGAGRLSHKGGAATVDAGVYYDPTPWPRAGALT